jgi:hypothetical protein
MRTIFVLLMLFPLTTGCTRPAAATVVTTLPVEVAPVIPVPDKPVAVTVQKIDSTMILITYGGGPDADHLVELETTIINGKGSVKTQPMGSRLDTTPVQRGGTEIFQESYTEKVHVLIIGYFANGTHQDILDTWI